MSRGSRHPGTPDRWAPGASAATALRPPLAARLSRAGRRAARPKALAAVPHPFTAAPPQAGRRAAPLAAPVTLALSLCLALLLLTAGRPAPAATLVVDAAGGGDYLTIQAGIDAAAPGDTVLVLAGTYTGAGNKELDFSGKSITVRSQDGAATTVIDCQNSGRGAHFHSGETAAAVFQGLTIRDGWAWYGGAILCEGASPTVLDCVLTECYALQAGGAVHGQAGAAPLFQGNTISLNETSPWGNGGGVSLDGAPATLEGNLLQGNAAGQGGGGIYCTGASPSVSGSAILGNRAGNNGGGIHCTAGASPRIEDSTLRDNEAEDDGGGLYCHDGASPWVLFNRIGRNQAGRYGGGIYCDQGSLAAIRGNDVYGNSAYAAGGIDCYTLSAPRVWRNRVRGNVSQNDGGGIRCFRADGAVISGNVVEANEARDGGGLSVDLCSPAITGNVIRDNVTEYGAAGILLSRECDSLAANNLVTGNLSGSSGGGLYVYLDSAPRILHCTFAGNSAAEDGGGIYSGRDAAPVIENSILWGNEAAEGGDQLHVPANGSAEVHYSDVMGGEAGVGGSGPLVWGPGNLDEDPVWVSTGGEYYLAHEATGHPKDSPCVDAGSAAAAAICFPWVGPETCLEALTTNLEGAPDSGTADLGYHYPGRLETLSCQLRCTPAEGTAPCSLRLTVLLKNLTPYPRTVAGRLELQLPSGTIIPEWRSGVYELPPSGGEYLTWTVSCPSLRGVAQEPGLTLFAEDVTPPPGNLPPYPPAGDTATDACGSAAVRTMMPPLAGRAPVTSPP